jgi:hypothetical protein
MKLLTKFLQYLTSALEGEVVIVEQRQTRVNHLRVEMSATLRVDFRQRNSYPQARAVRSVRGHRLDRVGHAENACPKNNLIALESLRIARTIHPLMVLQHHLRDRPGEVDALQNVISGLRMGLDQAILKFR